MAKEIEIWSLLNHDYVLPFLGYFTETSGMLPSLVSKWTVNGPLSSYMKKFPRGSLETWDLVRLLS